MRVDRLQLRWLADDAVLGPATCQRLRTLDNIVGAHVRPLFVRGDGDDQWSLQVGSVEPVARGNRCGQGPFHVSRAAAHQAPIFQRRREGIPAGVARHGVRVAEQAQPARPRALFRDQADLLHVEMVDVGQLLDGEAARLQHPAQEIGDRPVARLRLRGHCDQFTGKFDNVDLHTIALSHQVFFREGRHGHRSQGGRPLAC